MGMFDFPKSFVIAWWLYNTIYSFIATVSVPDSRVRYDIMSCTTACYLCSLYQHWLCCAQRLLSTDVTGKVAVTTLRDLFDAGHKNCFFFCCHVYIICSAVVLCTYTCILVGWACILEASFAMLHADEWKAMGMWLRYRSFGMLSWA